MNSLPTFLWKLPPKSQKLMMSVFCSNTLIFAPECWKCTLRDPDLKIFPEGIMCLNHEWARWRESCFLIGYSSGRDGAFLALSQFSIGPTRKNLKVLLKWTGNVHFCTICEIIFLVGRPWKSNIALEKSLKNGCNFLYESWSSWLLVNGPHSSFDT